MATTIVGGMRPHPIFRIKKYTIGNLYICSIVFYDSSEKGTQAAPPARPGALGTRGEPFHDRYEKEGEAAFLVLDHPPVNALGAELRLALFDCLDRAEADGSVAAAVLIGGGRMFSAGADIATFASVDAFLEPTLHATILDRLDAFTKPVVAALHGVTLGGGLELALGCHYRIAAPGARLGLPEITLGLNMTPQDHMGLDSSAFIIGVVKDGDWQLAQ